MSDTDSWKAIEYPAVYDEWTSSLYGREVKCKALFSRAMLERFCSFLFYTSIPKASCEQNHGIEYIICYCYR